MFHSGFRQVFPVVKFQSISYPKLREITRLSCLVTFLTIIKPLTIYILLLPENFEQFLFLVLMFFSQYYPSNLTIIGQQWATPKTETFMTSLTESITNCMSTHTPLRKVESMVKIQQLHSLPKATNESPNSSIWAAEGVGELHSLIQGKDGRIRAYFELGRGWT